MATAKRERHRQARQINESQPEPLARRLSERLRRVERGSWIFFGIITVAYIAVVFGATLNGKGVGPVSRTAILLTWPAGVLVAIGSTLWTNRRGRS